MKGSQNSKIKLRDPFMTPFDLILHFVDDVSFNLSVKFDANIFFTDRYMPILLFRWFGYEMHISAHFGEVFWGLTP